MGALDTILNGLSILLPDFAKSNGEIEAKIIDVVATYADSEAIERRNTETYIRQALATQKVTTKEYYRRKAGSFQIGDVLVYDPVNQGGYYEQINVENQIIKQAYIVGSNPDWTMLVNAVGSDGHLRVLTSEELGSFKTYFEAFQPLGLEINIISLEVAKISDPNIIIYVQTGTDAGQTASDINNAFLAYESVLRSNNMVTLSEIEDVIQTVQGVLAIGFSDIVAEETLLDGSVVQVRPELGVFELTNGAFTFTTEITTNNIRTL